MKANSGIVDLLVLHARIIDGGGRAPFSADVGVKDGKVEAIGDLSGCRARRVIRAPGCFVAPGFIDIHSHSDYSLLYNPRAESKVRQGVTTEVVGNCGSSAFPLYGEKRRRAREQNSKLAIDWFTLGGWRRRLMEKGSAVNLVSLTGHGNLRGSVIGYDDRPPTRAEMRKMLGLLEKSLEEGSAGISTGLIYPPGVYSGFRELKELVRLVARSGGIYATHMRNEGGEVDRAVGESIRLAESAGVSLEISHLKTQGRRNWHLIGSCFEKIETARGRGLDVHCDRYPYVASSTDLDILLPEWAYRGGNAEELKRLADPATRERIKRGIAWEDWGAVVISKVGSKAGRRWEGKKISEIARGRRVSPSDCLIDILREEKLAVEALFFSLSQRNLRRILSRPYCMIGSDASAKADYGVLSRGKPHPRAYGTFPRVLREWAAKGSLSWQEAVYKMTGLPASKLGLKDRGMIRAGAAADLVIFNPSAVGDTATFKDPHRYPEGIEYVIVNGEIVVEKGRHTGRLPGRFIHSPENRPDRHRGG